MSKKESESKKINKEEKQARKAGKKAVRKARRENRDNIRYKYLAWYKLDNSAHLFPVIAGENMTNTYRISATLTEDVDPVILQSALDTLLPKFPPFNVRLRRGLFWYYFEENGRKAPTVREEASFPCTYIHSKLNREYLFRVSYYKNRINLEVFHVLTDGMGGINFLKELVYHYLRLKHPEISKLTGNGLTSGTSMNSEDSFLRNYRRASKPLYASKKAYHIKGEHLRDHQFGVISLSMDINALKTAAHKYGLSINEYLVGVYAYSIYNVCLHAMQSKHPIRIAVPVNLRSYFDSVTTRNFFVMISASLDSAKENLSFEEVLSLTRDSLKSQMSKEHLENIFSYNVSNQANIFLRLMPLLLKNIAMKCVYTKTAKANTTTMTNIGCINVEDAYKPYIENFNAILSMSKGQLIKATICSYAQTINVTFGSVFRDVSIQQFFVKKLTEDNVDISLETNGVYYG